MRALVCVFACLAGVDGLYAKGVGACVRGVGPDG